MTKKELKNGTLLLAIVGIIAVAFLAIIIRNVFLFNNANIEIEELTTEKIELEKDLVKRDSIVNDFVNAFDSIESNLTFINKKRNLLVLETSETKATRQQVIIRDIRLMDNMLEESSKKIEELENKLKKSGMQLHAFKNKIASLNKSIAKQNYQIAEFKLHIEDQNAQLAKANQENGILQNTVLAYQDSIKFTEEILAQKEEIIEDQIRKMNKGFFASGTFKELLENGVVEKQGGFFGIGTNKILHNTINEDYFTQVDITENKTISLNARKINLISEHPVNSYKLIEEDGLITKLEIEVPKDFWKISHYAVIEVKL